MYAAIGSTHPPPGPQLRTRRASQHASSLFTSSTRSVSVFSTDERVASETGNSPKKDSHKRRSSLAHIAIESLEGLKQFSSPKEHRRSRSITKTFGNDTATNLDPFNGSSTLLSSSFDTPPDIKSSSSPRKRHLRSPPLTSRNNIPPPSLPTIPLLPRTAYESGAYKQPLATPPTAGSMTPLAQSATPPDYFSIKPRTRQGSPKLTGKRIPQNRNPIPQSPPRSPINAQKRPRNDSQSLSSPSRMALGLRKEADRQSPEKTEDCTVRNVRDDGENRRPRERRPGSTSPRREAKEKDRKSMLSRALQKANTAVILDNEQNYEGAVDAYSEACRLLQDVMDRSSGEDDRRKLNAIRTTYTNRIDELRQLELDVPPEGSKSLPPRPVSGEATAEDRQTLMMMEESDEKPEEDVIETATVTRIISSPDEKPAEKPMPTPPIRSPRSPRGPSNRDSTLSSAFRGVEETIPTPSMFHLELPERPGVGRALTYGSEMDTTYMPPPLSPRRPLTPDKLDTTAGAGMEEQQSPDRDQVQSTDSTSWLAPIEESDASSCASSIHSVDEGVRRRKHIRSGSGQTEVEFDAALDAAIEAAYDDGFEPYRPESESYPENDLGRMLGGNNQLEQERQEELDREELIRAAKQREKERLLRGESLPLVRNSLDLGFDDDIAEEERLLEEMTKEYMLDGFDFGLQSKSALPRESDGSTFSGGTWNSSRSSNRTTAGTNMTGITDMSEASTVGKITRKMSVTGTLSTVSEGTASGPPPADAPPRLHIDYRKQITVRDRRKSGQNARQLKIETSINPPSSQRAPKTEGDIEALLNPVKVEVSNAPMSAFPGTGSSGLLPSAMYKSPGVPSSSTLHRPLVALDAISPAETHVTISPATPAVTDTVDFNNILDGSPGKLGRLPPPLRKNKSSLSLNKLSLSSPDGSERSVSTPMSTTFSTFSGRARTGTSANVPPTPGMPSFNVDGTPMGGMNLFESNIHSPESPGLPNPLALDAPLALEPCPESYLLRPYWLMRAFYQTICHPRGGYLSTKLFVPRDVWRVKGVKLKAIDDKIANCDLLTAATQKLAQVNTLDADAVLEEMSALESVLDQVQANLTKKLGNEVGTHNVQALFKEAPVMGGETNQFLNPMQAQNSTAGGRYLSTWRKLRPKNSGVGLNGGFASSAGGTVGVTKENLSMPSLPMTNLPAIRFAKRDVTGVDFQGPNATYMASLARLFDAVQVLDQIARQVEDPGLRGSSATYVGLELSVRHASEFFAFYVCRFVLTDVQLLLDKFIKRGSEWVLV